MKNAKEMGYKIELWGTSDAIERLGDLADSIVNVDNFEFKLYDDIKVKIWENITPLETTIDGDVFLFDSNFNSDGISLNVDCEFTRLSNEGKIVLDNFNKFNPKEIIPEWDINNTIGLNTGLVNWGTQTEFKKYYIESYWKLRKWYFDKQSEMIENTPTAHNMYPAISHIICENLLYQLVKYYKIKYKQFKNNPNFNYLHKSDENTTKNGDFKISIGMMYGQLRFSNMSVKEMHKRMVNSGMLPFLFCVEK